VLLLTNTSRLLTAHLVAAVAARRAPIREAGRELRIVAQNKPEVAGAARFALRECHASAGRRRESGGRPRLRARPEVSGLRQASGDER
jgi:hypothetical protein